MSKEKLVLNFGNSPLVALRLLSRVLQVATSRDDLDVMMIDEISIENEGEERRVLARCWFGSEDRRFFTEVFFKILHNKDKFGWRLSPSEFAPISIIVWNDDLKVEVVYSCDEQGDLTLKQDEMKSRELKQYVAGILPR
jgi:hypothetical protein